MQAKTQEGQNMKVGQNIQEDNTQEDVTKMLQYKKAT